MTQSIESRMNELYTLIEHHAGLYYDDDNPEISDSEYDALVRELAGLEREYPEYARKDSRTQRVGGHVSELFAPVKHDVPMLSLDNVYQIDPKLTPKEKVSMANDSLVGFFNGVDQSKGFVCEMKIDGLAVSLVYEDGVFVQGTTRGDGRIGEDVTENLRLIESVPKTLTNAPVGRVEVRGEVYMTIEKFDAVNKLCEERGIKTFANPRNAAGGLLRNKGNEEFIKAGLDIFLYYLVDAERFRVTRQSEALLWLSEHGLPVQSAYSFCASLDDAKSFIWHWQNEKLKLNYNADGVVVKLDDMTLWPELGATDHAPRWAVAYKYPPEEARTRVKDIIISVGRMGTLTPIAILEPVLVAGSTIQRASLHNAEYIWKKDIRIGDYVYINKAGEIIPQVDRVDTSARTGDERFFVMPNHCPACGADVVKKERVIIRSQQGTPEVVVYDKMLFCTNPSCPAQLKESIKHFVSRKAMDIRGIGKVLAYQLVDSGKVHNLADIYRLTREDWLSVGTGDKNTQKVMNEIEQSKTRPLASFITALGIPNVEKTLAEKLAAYFGSIQTLEDAQVQDIIKALTPSIESEANTVYDFLSNGGRITTEQPTIKALTEALMTIPDMRKSTAGKLARYFRTAETLESASVDEIIRALTDSAGKIIAWAVYKFFRDDSNISLINDFRALGLNLNDVNGTDRVNAPSRYRKRLPGQPSELQEDRFKGKVFVFTGTLSSMTRYEAGERVLALGGQFSDNVTLKTSYLVVGEKPGSKLTKAENLNIPILSEQEFMKMAVL